ncbi:Dapk1 [Symbiodinium natans]|uniref:Dapk1 protein n=1 Tax=Symbiodinium natans TaxID=878477 RepID=A0A812JNJ1_9DINO|nr:Dapk1 [Symbiodinium natans]
MEESLEGGATVLIVAAYKGDVEVVQLLCELKADVNRPQSDHASPLFVVAEKSHLEGVTECFELCSMPALKRTAGTFRDHDTSESDSDFLLLQQDQATQRGTQSWVGDFCDIWVTVR